MTVQYRNIARVVRPHGSKGEVLVAPLRGLPFLLHKGLTCALTPPALERDRFCRVIKVTEGGSEMLVSFSGIDNLDAAESIAGCYVLVQADDIDLDPLTAPVDNLIGRTVVDERYGELGAIAEVICTPANNVWSIMSDSYGEVLVPVISSVVSAIPDDGPISIHVMDGIVPDGSAE